LKLRGILYYSVLTGHTVSEASRIGRRLALACIDALRVAGESAGPADPGRLQFPPRGKPHYPGGPQFSISHSLPLVACAAVSHGDVGLDVECDDAVLRLSLATISDDAERTLAREIGVRHVWMAKEAALKAGGGTIEHIGAVRVFAGGATFRGRCYHECRLALADDRPAAVMTSEPGVPFEVHRL
jgi:phosphopantetheinyl transferase